jgi:hypothetical protein
LGQREAKYFCNQRWFRHNPDTTDLPVGQSHTTSHNEDRKL